MKFRALLDRLPIELTLLSSAYVAEAPSHEKLASYPTLASLRDGLHRPGKRSTEQRKDLIALVVRVHQIRPHRIWSALLLQVFTPLVRKLRKELVGGDPETRDEILLEQIHEVLLRVRADDPPRIFMYVRQGLRRRVFKALAEVTAWEEVGFGTDADLEPDPKTVEEPRLLGVWLKGLGTRPEQVELLTTLVDPGGLASLVRRRHPRLRPAARTRAYERLRKKRTLLVSKLRGQLEPSERGS